MKKNIKKYASLALITTMMGSQVIVNAQTVYALNNKYKEEIVVESSVEHENYLKLIINEVYGGGGKEGKDGNTNAPYKYDFIEIYNPTNEEINLEGLSLRYTNNSGKIVQEYKFGSEHTIKANDYFLLRCESTLGNDADKGYGEAFEADAYYDSPETGIGMSDTKGNVELLKDEELVDAVAFGNPDTFKGEGNSVEVLDIYSSARRVNFQDSNNNADDFEKVEASPTKSGSKEGEVSIVNEETEKPNQPDQGETPDNGNDTEKPEEDNTETPDNEITIKDTIDVEKIANYYTGTQNADGGVAEIVKFNSDNNKMYVINGIAQTIDVISLDNVKSDDYTNLEKDKSINVANLVNSSTFTYGDLTSIDINTKEKVVVVVVQEKDYTKSGKIVVMDYDGNLIKTFDAGIQPDMVKMTEDGKYILSANEGEPRQGYVNGVDPEGSVTVVDYKNENARNVKFDDSSVIDSDVHIRNNEGGAKLDLEPEYIAVNNDNTKAYVSLQENNAIATIDIRSGKVLSVKSLGFKDHSLEENKLDAARDDKIELETLPILGVYMPDGISYVNIGGVDYILTANEGDATEWGEYTNIEKFSKVKDKITIESNLFKGMTKEEAQAKLDEMKSSKKYDKLEVITDMGTDAIYTLGGRSFAMFKADTMELVFDSGDDFEQITSERYPKYFNSNNDEVALDSRSTKKGPEPEDVKVGKVGDKLYAFTGLERIGGVMTYDITNPNDIKFVNYENSRDFSGNIAGDSAPEGLDFIPASQSSTGTPLLLVANEVSGTVAVNEIEGEKVDVGTEDDKITDINIYHTNDTHSRVESTLNADEIQTNIGFAKFKEYIDQTSEDVDGKLVLDAGDTLHGKAFATLENGESVAKVLNAVGYDAIAPGNHDFNYGQDKLSELAEIAGVEVLAGNVKTEDDKLKYEDTMIKEIGDVKVGIFGLATPETSYKTNPNNVKGLDFGDKKSIIEDTKEMIEDLEKQGADIIVGVSHLGIDADSEVKSADVVKAVDGIDLLIDGHSHSSKENYEKIGDTIITSTGEYFENMGLVNIKYDEENDKLIEVNAKEIKAAELTNIEEDTEVKELIDFIKEGQEEILSEVIGKTEIDLNGAREFVRTGHTNLGYLLTSSMLSETKADIALTNGGGIRDSIAKGDITKGDVLQVLPFGNYIVTIEATGQQIIDALNHGLVVGAGSFTHFAGMEVKVKEVKNEDITRYEVVSITIDGKEIDKNSKYTVATNDFLAVGGDDYTMLSECKLLNEFSSLDEALIKYIQSEGEAGINLANEMNLLSVIDDESQDGADGDDSEDDENQGGEDNEDDSVDDENQGGAGGDDSEDDENQGGEDNEDDLVDDENQGGADDEDDSDDDKNQGGTDDDTNAPKTYDTGILGYLGLGLAGIIGLVVNRFKRK